MSIDKKLILNLLADDRIKKLLADQDKAYWESLMTASVSNGTSEINSLVKLTFLLAVCVFNELLPQETYGSVYRLLKTLSIDNDNALGRR